MFNPERPPEITARRWLNSDKKHSLKAEKGKVIVVAVFQMTCPGSQKFGLPQAMRLRKAFEENEVAIFGLHMAFEKHDEQTPEKVEAFLAENEITIPVALDKSDGENLPETMKAYELQGTPAILMFDRQGRLRRHYLGAVDDLRIGAEVMAMLIEDKNSPREMSIAIESKLQHALVDPEAHAHNHEHGDACGCGHDHDHAHEHGHDHGHDHAHHAHAGHADRKHNEPASAPAHGEPGHVHGPGCKH